MSTAVVIVGGIFLYCLILPWAICYMHKDKNPFVRYLDWVYDIVNGNRRVFSKVDRREEE